MDRLYTLKESKQLLGVQTKTIQRWDQEGQIRVVRTPGGRRRVPESEILRIQGREREKERVIGYARVTSPSQEDDLERQVKLIKNRGVEEALTDIRSALNERRSFKKILKMVVEKESSKIEISYPDRLTRFGFETL